jgi:hypothetical protein
VRPFRLGRYKSQNWNLKRLVQLSPKAEHNRSHQEQKRYSMIPFEALTELEPGKDDEHAKSDHFLNDF